MDLHRTVSFLSIPTALLCSGYQACFSQNSIPILLSQPVSMSAPAFTQLYNRGITIVVPGAILASLGFGTLAYSAKSDIQRKLYATSAVCSLSVMAFTRTYMANGLAKLLEMGGDALQQEKAAQSGEAVRLLKAWSGQNWVRSALFLSAGVLGMVASSDLV